MKTNLTRETHLKIKDLATDKHGTGILSISASVIWKRIKKGQFPQPRRYPHIKGPYWTWGDIQDWMNGEGEWATQSSDEEVCA